MKFIFSLKEIEGADEGDWFSGGGECCGFDAFIKGSQVVCEDRACGGPTIWKGKISLEAVKKIAQEIAQENTLTFDEWGELLIPIEKGVCFLIDRDEQVYVPGAFSMKMV